MVCTCTMNFAVSAWQPADASWACEPTKKRQVVESADSATVCMVVVVAVAAVERW